MTPSKMSNRDFTRYEFTLGASTPVKPEGSPKKKFVISLNHTKSGQRSTRMDIPCGVKGTEFKQDRGGDRKTQGQARGHLNRCYRTPRCKSPQFRLGVRGL